MKTNFPKNKISEQVTFYTTTLLNVWLHRRQPDSHIFSIQPVVIYCFGWNIRRKSDFPQMCSWKGRILIVFSGNSKHNSLPIPSPFPHLRFPKYFQSQYRAPAPTVKTVTSMSPASFTHSPFIPTQLHLFTPTPKLIHFYCTALLVQNIIPPAS